MSVKPVRIQVPAGGSFDGVLTEAAAKVAWRNGFDDLTSAALVELVSLSAAAANSAKPDTVTLELEARPDSIRVEIGASNPTTTMSPDTLAALTKSAKPANDLTIDASLIRFHG